MKPKCRFCCTKVVSRPRGLCWHCYYDPFVKAFFGIQSAADIAKLKATRKPPTDPTEIPAGPRRVEIYCKRYERGEHLFCVEDTRRIDKSTSAGPRARKQRRAG